MDQVTLFNKKPEYEMSVFVGLSVPALVTSNFNGSVFKTDKECVLCDAETFHIVKVRTFLFL